MRALTLTQPWAGLVAAGIKLVENREQGVIKASDFGTPFAIHASREIDEGVYARIDEIQPGLCRGHVRGGGTSIGDWWHRSRVTGAVIAVAVVDRCVRSTGISSNHPGTAYGYDPEELAELGDQRRWLFGRYGYVLRDVRALAEPVPCRGALGFWTLPADVAARVEAQLR